MKAIALNLPQSTNDSEWFAETEIATPIPEYRDLLVRVKAISVNPVDYKVRGSSQLQQQSSKILGWDVAGIVEAVGNEVTLFKTGDEVYYAGSFIRAGNNSEYHVVDERIVGKKPASLSYAEAAALPLTTITAWEAMMFTKSMYETEDMQSQHDLLNQVAILIDQGILKTSITENLGILNIANLAKAHRLLESGTAIGKVVLSGME